MYVTLPLNLLSIATMIHQDIQYGNLHGRHKVSQKFNQREATQKLRKGEQSFLHATRCPDLIHIVIKFHQDIPYGYLVMACIRIVWRKKKKKKKKIHQRKVTQKLRKGEQSF